MIKEKILCLGDNTSAEAWAHRLASEFAQKNNLIFRGAIIETDQNFENGCYHIGPGSLQQTDIIYISKKFNRIWICIIDAWGNFSIDSHVKH